VTSKMSLLDYIPSSKNRSKIFKDSFSGKHIVNKDKKN